MSRHSERFNAGMQVVVGLAVLAFVIAICVATWKVVISPRLQMVLGGIAGIIGTITVTYIIGYLVTDLPDDIREWSS